MAFFRKAEQFIQLRQGGDNGLLAENVLSGQQRSLGLLKVQAVGGGDIHQFHFRVCQHLVVLGIDLGNMKLVGHCNSGVCVARIHGNNRHCCKTRKLLCHRVGDRACSNHSNIHRGIPFTFCFEDFALQTHWATYDTSY